MKQEPRKYDFLGSAWFSCEQSGKAVKTCQWMFSNNKLQSRLWIAFFIWLIESDDKL